MNLTLDRLLSAWNAGQPMPEDLAGNVTMPEAYRMQAQVLRRRLNAGKQHTGWKIGQTNAQMREERGEDSPAPGFLAKHTTG